MNTYLLLKWLHVLSSTVLFGTGIGIALFKWLADRRGDVRAIRVTCEHVVLADWLFTTPAVVLQPLSGLALVLLAGYPLSAPWLVAAFILYALAGACWLVVLRLQLRMRALARAADAAGESLPAQYWRDARHWFRLGVPAFAALVLVFWLMVARPA